MAKKFSMFNILAQLDLTTLKQGFTQRVQSKNLISGSLQVTKEVSCTDKANLVDTLVDWDVKETDLTEEMLRKICERDKLDVVFFPFEPSFVRATLRHFGDHRRAEAEQKDRAELKLPHSSSRCSFRSSS